MDFPRKFWLKLRVSKLGLWVLMENLERKGRKHGWTGSKEEDSRIL